MYNNCFTITSPGLLVFMVDQSATMSELWADGKSKAECAAIIINRLIEESIANNYDVFENEVRERVMIVVVGYGGVINSDNAYVIVKGSNKELANSPLRI